MTARNGAFNDRDVSFLVRQPRAFVSALLLVVQVLGLGHVALARHALGDDGAVIDVAPLATEAHDDRAEHLCAGDVAIHADAPDDCLVVAGFSSPSLITAAVTLRSSPGSLVGGIARASSLAVQLDILSRAPKASPPRV